MALRPGTYYIRTMVDAGWTLGAGVGDGIIKPIIILPPEAPKQKWDVSISGSFYNFAIGGGNAVNFGGNITSANEPAKWLVEYDWQSDTYSIREPFKHEFGWFVPELPGDDEVIEVQDAELNDDVQSYFQFEALG